MSVITVNEKEIINFAKISYAWHDEDSPEFKILHKMNPIRLHYILHCIENFGQSFHTMYHGDSFSFKDNFQKAKAIFDHIMILDIGCGGGLSSIPLARMGSSVTGIDPCEEAIKSAKKRLNIYKKYEKLDLTFYHSSIEDFSDIPGNKNMYDVIILFEVLEHVDNLSTFLNRCALLLRKGGLIIISTINRTLQSYLKCIIGAEYIARMVPKNTHQYNKFLKPSEILNCLNGFTFCDIVGLRYDLILSDWVLSKEDISQNYFMTLTKKI